MIKNSYKVIGLLSVTSLVGLDMVFCEFEKTENNWSFLLKAAKGIDYDEPLRMRLKDSIQLSAIDLLILNNEYGQWLGEQVVAFCHENSIEAELVASHGHTVLHQPHLGITYQIGSGQHLANTCGIDVICDFRRKDVALGGQGAPLVPIGDKHLFSEYNFCLNLGGISNVSFDHNGERLAFDIGLANMVLNYLTSQVGLTYDNNGAMARSGKLCEDLLDKLNQLAYYQLPYPKSTGYEWFCEEVVPIIDSSDASIENKLCTSVHHIAFQVAESVKKFSFPGSRMLVTGGGVKNSFLIDTLIKFTNGKVEVVVPDESIVNYKEAIVFAFMGVLCDLKEINCLQSVTGAHSDSSAGVRYDSGLPTT